MAAHRVHRVRVDDFYDIKYDYKLAAHNDKVVTSIVLKGIHPSIERVQVLNDGEAKVLELKRASLADGRNIMPPWGLKARVLRFVYDPTRLCFEEDRIGVDESKTVVHAQVCVPSVTIQCSVE